MKNPLTPAGIEPATFRIVAQHLNHCATAVSKIWKDHFELHTVGYSNTMKGTAHCLIRAWRHSAYCLLDLWPRVGSTAVHKVRQPLQTLRIFSDTNNRKKKTDDSPVFVPVHQITSSYNPPKQAQFLFWWCVHTISDNRILHSGDATHLQSTGYYAGEEVSIREEGSKHFWGVSSPLCVEKTNSEVNISHETTTMVVRIYDDI